jgi:hypothetical protein
MREMTFTGLADWQLKRMVETVRSHLLTFPKFHLYEILLTMQGAGPANWAARRRQMFETVRSSLLALADFHLYEILLQEKQATRQRR